MMAIKRIQVRRDTSSNWGDMEGVLADGELGYDKVNKDMRVGDGVTPFFNLPVLGASKREVLLHDGLPVASTLALGIEDAQIESNWWFSETADFMSCKLLLKAQYMAEAKENLTVDGYEVQAGQRFNCGQVDLIGDGNQRNIEKLWEWDEAGAYNKSIEIATDGQNYAVINGTEVDAAKWKLFLVYVVM